MNAPIRRSAPKAAPAKVAPVQRRPQGTAPATEHVEGRAVVNSQYKVRKEERGASHHESVEEVVRFEPGEVAALVRVSIGKTIATAPFESVRVDVSVSLPCLPENVEATYQRASTLAEGYLIEEEARWSTQ